MICNSNKYVAVCHNGTDTIESFGSTVEGCEKKIHEWIDGTDYKGSEIIEVPRYVVCDADRFCVAILIDGYAVNFIPDRIGDGVALYNAYTDTATESKWIYENRLQTGTDQPDCIKCSPYQWSRIVETAQVIFEGIKNKK